MSGGHAHDWIYAALDLCRACACGACEVREGALWIPLEQAKAAAWRRRHHAALAIGVAEPERGVTIEEAIVLLERRR